MTLPQIIGPIRITVDDRVVYQMQSDRTWVNLFTEQEVCRSILKAHFPDQLAAAEDEYFNLTEPQECGHFLPEQSCKYCKGESNG